MLTANGLTLPPDEWARRLNVAPSAITYALAQGLTMQAIANFYTQDRYEQINVPVSRPSTPPNLPARHAGPLQRTPGGSFTFKALCVNCADKAKNFYDLAHSAHKEQMWLEEKARERAWHDSMFDFLDFDAAGHAQAHVAASVVKPAEGSA